MIDNWWWWWYYCADYGVKNHIRICIVYEINDSIVESTYPCKKNWMLIIGDWLKINIDKLILNTIFQQVNHCWISVNRSTLNYYWYITDMYYCCSTMNLWLYLWFHIWMSIYVHIIVNTLIFEIHKRERERGRDY